MCSSTEHNYCTLQLRETDAPRYEASFHVERKLNKRTRAWWDDFVSETIIEEWWPEHFGMSRAPLYKLADDLSKSGYKWTSKFFNLPKIKRNKAIETKNTNFWEIFHRGNFRTNGKRPISYKFQLHVSLKSQTKNTHKNVYNFFCRVSNNPSQIKNQWHTKQKRRGFTCSPASTSA